jgi:hypothetical protein
MRRYGVIVFLGAVAAALAARYAPAADAIDASWPYGTGASMEAPGFYDVLGWTDGGRDQFGPISSTHGDYTVAHSVDGPDWYTAHITNFVVPSFYSNEHIEVLSLLDDSAGYPSAGTVFDTTKMFDFNFPIGGMMHLFTTTVIDDPELGYASQFSITPFFTNTFLITDGGMKDFVTTFGWSYTLFEIPFTDASGGADASDDAFTPLLAEFAASGT